jgi:ATP-dependent Lhr-like helicase
VLDHGHLVAYLERGGRSILTFQATGDDARWAEALTTLVKDGRLRSLEIARIDAVPARESAHHPALLAAGFVGGYRGLIYRGH